MAAGLSLAVPATSSRWRGRDGEGAALELVATCYSSCNHLRERKRSNYGSVYEPLNLQFPSALPGRDWSDGSCMLRRRRVRHPQSIASHRITSHRIAGKDPYGVGWGKTMQRKR